MPCLWMHGITRGCWSLRILSDSCRGVLPRLLPAGRDTRLPRMADILTPKQRSALMACIRSEGNASTELRLVAALRTDGITGGGGGSGWRCADSGRLPVTGGRLPMPGGHANGRGLKHPATTDRSCGQGPDTGHRSLATGTVRPDFVFRTERLVVFVDGCFWHGCPAHYTRPKARRTFWDAKIAANRARDRRIDRALRAAGWRVLHIWEHALTPGQLGRTLARVKAAVTSCR